MLIRVIGLAHQNEIHAFCAVRLSTTAAILVVVDIDKGWMGVGPENRRVLSLFYDQDKLTARDPGSCGTCC